MAYIEINDVSKVYQRVGEPFHALSHVSLEIERGEFICLLGPSGCGFYRCQSNLAQGPFGYLDRANLPSLRDDEYDSFIAKAISISV